MFTDVAHKQVGQFVGLYEDREVSFGKGLKFRVVVYAAERAGAICPEYNGIAVLRDTGKVSRSRHSKGQPEYTVIAKRVAQANSGYYGMTGDQRQTLEALCSASFPEFQALLGKEIAPMLM